MQLTLNSLLSWTASHHSPEKSSPMTESEKACHDKIVRDVLNSSSARLDHELFPSCSPPRRTYVIAFKQSKSWAPVIDDLKIIQEAINKAKKETSLKIFENQKILSNSKLSTPAQNLLKQKIDLIKAQKVFLENLETAVKKIESSIKLTEMHQEHLSKCLDAFYECQIEQNKLYFIKEHVRLEILKDQENRIRDEINNSKAIILLCLKTIGESGVLIKQLSKQNQASIKNYDPEIREHLTGKILLSYLSENWPQLSVGFHWPEISLMEDKLCVRLYKPTEKKNLQDFIDSDSSTKAFFVIEEKQIEKTDLVYTGSKSGKIVRPTEVGIKDKCFGPATPSPIKRQSSSVKVTNEIFYGTAFGEEEEEFIRLEKMKSITSAAARLEEIVQRSLKEVNQKLQSQSSTESVSQGKESPSDSSNQINCLFFLLQPFLKNAT
jgi:hypothetical protein